MSAQESLFDPFGAEFTILSSVAVGPARGGMAPSTLPRRSERRAVRVVGVKVNLFRARPIRQASPIHLFVYWSQVYYSINRWRTDRNSRIESYRLYRSSSCQNWSGFRQFELLIFTPKVHVHTEVNSGCSQSTAP